MKSRVISIFLSLAVLVLLAACGGEAAGDPSEPAGDLTGSAQTPAPTEGQAAGTEAFSFVTNGTEIAIDQDMAEVLAALGECQSYFEAESCAFAGLDKTYTYAGFVITTRPDGDRDFVNSIRLTDDSAVTQEGAYIGCTADQVRAIYGDEENGPAGALSYAKGDTVLNFILEDDAVISIEYLPA